MTVAAMSPASTQSTPKGKARACGNALPKPTPDKTAILAALAAMFDPTDVIEIRAFPKGKKHTAVGYFDGEHREDLADAAVTLNAAGAAVYVTLNRIDPQLLGRYCNRIENPAAAAVTDANVIRRRWLLIDFDPVRPKDTSATNAQLAAAHERARDCARWLKSNGWPNPLAGESGNGWHLLYPLDLPTDTESRDLVKGVLAALAERFDDEVVTVDQAVFNAGRITKLFGTVANKGDHTPLTPWRLSRLVKAPERGAPVTPDQLRALHPKGNGADSKRERVGDRFDLLAFLSCLGIQYDHDLHEGADRYKLEHCPFNPDHGKGEAAIFQQPDGRLGFKCQHNSCADKTWADVRALVDGPHQSGHWEASGGDSVSSGCPAALDPCAYYGIAGDLIKAIEPHTEADPAALLVQVLVAFGILVQRAPYVPVEGDRHYANLFALLVGGTAKGRKGTSWGRVRSIFDLVSGWPRVVSGLSSGEGLKYQVRDPRTEMVKNKKSGETSEEVVDEGVKDKRLLVTEPEFAQVLRAVARQGNTLSSTVRNAWDTGDLATLTKNDPITATGAHIGIIGHVTVDELRAELTQTDTANGFANRFLFVCVRRSKCLPFGGDALPKSVLDNLARRIDRAASLSKSVGPVHMTATARDTWAGVYPRLSEGSLGLFGAATARAEAQAIRLAMIYALLDEKAHIDLPHLLAALAVWEYAEASARYVFGSSLGDPVADDILRAVRAAGQDGMTRTQIRDLFKRNRSAERIGAALDLLDSRSLVRRRSQETGGRPTEVWERV